MSEAVYAHIRENPKFKELVARRSRFAWTLAVIVLTLFYGFVMTVAFMPASLGQPIAEGSMITLGVVAELFMFIFFWGLTAFYVHRANTQFDAINQEVVAAAWKETRK